MNKIKMFNVKKETENEVNEFIKDKKVIQIVVTPESDNYWSVITILYEEVTN